MTVVNFFLIRSEILKFYHLTVFMTLVITFIHSVCSLIVGCLAVDVLCLCFLPKNECSFFLNLS